MYKKILIFDPNPSSAAATAKLFRYFHYGTTLAYNAEILEKRLQQGEYDIVVLDETVDEKTIQRSRELQPKAHVGLLRSEFSGIEDTKFAQMNFFEVLKRPLTQEKVFEFILNLYGEGKKRIQSKEDLEAMMAPYAGSRIIIADDNPINQAVIMGLFSKIGLKGLLASNGEEVLKLLRNEKVDLILMDLNMPVMDGAEAAQKIRSELGLHDLPIVALSADMVGAEQLEKMQMQAYLAKPLEIPQFYGTLAKLLPKRREVQPEVQEDTNLFLQESGFDLEKGLERAGGNYDLYIQVVKNFLNNAFEIHKELQQKLESGNVSDSIRLASLIISSAENVHATLYQELGAKLYHALQDRDAPKVEEYVKELESQLKRSMEKIHEANLYRENMQKRKHGAPQGSKKFFLDKLKELEHAVQERRPYHCNKAIEALESYWWSVEYAKIIEKVSLLFKEYRFDMLEKYLYMQINKISES